MKVVRHNIRVFNDLSAYNINLLQMLYTKFVATFVNNTKFYIPSYNNRLSYHGEQ
jgi:hypothetical protein